MRPQMRATVAVHDKRITGHAGKYDTTGTRTLDRVGAFHSDRLANS